MPSKYDKLRDYLGGSDARMVTLSFRDIDRMVPGGLPPSAFKLRQWWSNESAQARSWKEAGFKVSQVEFNPGEVRFRRVR